MWVEKSNPMESKILNHTFNENFKKIPASELKEKENSFDKWGLPEWINEDFKLQLVEMIKRESAAVDEVLAYKTEIEQSSARVNDWLERLVTRKEAKNDVVKFQAANNIIYNPNEEKIA